MKALSEDSVLIVCVDANVAINDFTSQIFHALQNENKDFAAVLETLRPISNEFVQKIEDEE